MAKSDQVKEPDLKELFADMHNNEVAAAQNAEKLQSLQDIISGFRQQQQNCADRIIMKLRESNPGAERVQVLVKEELYFIVLSGSGAIVKQEPIIL